MSISKDSSPGIKAIQYKRSSVAKKMDSINSSQSGASNPTTPYTPPSSLANNKESAWTTVVDMPPPSSSLSASRNPLADNPGTSVKSEITDQSQEQQPRFPALSKEALLKAKQNAAATQQRLMATKALEQSKASPP